MLRTTCRSCLLCRARFQVSVEVAGVAGGVTTKALHLTVVRTELRRSDGEGPKSDPVLMCLIVLTPFTCTS
jgi:hypothetical protein